MLIISTKQVPGDSTHSRSRRDQNEIDLVSTQRGILDRDFSWKGYLVVAEALRGFQWAVYLRDDGIQQYARLVDKNSFADPVRGWPASSAAGVPLFPQRGRPRIVYGVSETTGRRGSTICGSTTAPLWTGEATTFEVETTDAGRDVLTVTRRRGESFAVPR